MLAEFRSYELLEIMKDNLPNGVFLRVDLAVNVGDYIIRKLILRAHETCFLLFSVTAVNT